MNRLSLLSLTALLLTACTGTEEVAPSIRLAVVTDGGAAVRTVTVGGAAAQPSADAPVPIDATNVNRAVDVDTLPGGVRLALTRTLGIESRDVKAGNPQPFAPPFEATGFTAPCLKATVLNAQRDRLLTLSQCDTAGAANGPQQLALYRTDGTLVWRAALPAFTPPSPGGDVPPVRIALLRENGVDVGIVARPALGGGSEVMRAAAPTTGAERADVSLPVATPAIRDLAPAPGGTVVYAATDTGVQPLIGAGVPDAEKTLTGFGAERVDRLWTQAGSGLGGNLIAVWRDADSGVSQSLRLWDASGTRAAASTVTSVADLRDLTFAPDGNIYVLTRTTLTGYDTLFGLTQGNWRPSVLLSGLNEARAVTWLVP